MDRIVGGSPAHQNVPATLTGVGSGAICYVATVVLRRGIFGATRCPAYSL